LACQFSAGVIAVRHACRTSRKRIGQRPTKGCSAEFCAARKTTRRFSRVRDPRRDKANAFAPSEADSERVRLWEKCQTGDHLARAHCMPLHANSLEFIFS
jgi:hypothetical protein